MFEHALGIPRGGMGGVHMSVGMPAATEWPSAFSVVQTAACLGSFPQTGFIPSAAESLFWWIIATDSLDWCYPANVQQHQLQGDWREHCTGRLLLCEGSGLQQPDRQSVLLEAFWHAASQPERHFTHLHPDREHREGKMSMDTILILLLFVLASVLLATNGKPCSPCWGRAAVPWSGLHEYRQHQELVLHHLPLPHD